MAGILTYSTSLSKRHFSLMTRTIPRKKLYCGVCIFQIRISKKLDIASTRFKKKKKKLGKKTIEIHLKKTHQI